MNSWLNTIGITKERADIAVVYTHARCVIEFAGSMASLMWLNENLERAIDFDDQHGDMIILKSTRWINEDDNSRSPEFEIIQEVNLTKFLQQGA